VGGGRGSVGQHVIWGTKPGRLVFFKILTVCKKISSQSFIATIQLWYLRKSNITRTEWPTILNQSWIYPKWIKGRLQNHSNAKT
jgi:hypothetical protein